jgi:hypothetical protein
VTNNSPPENRDRNWKIWRRRLDGETFTSIGAAFGISPERVRQITAKCERRVRSAIRRDSFPVPTESLRDELLGVEFVFSHKQHVPDGVKSNCLGLSHDRYNPNRGIYWWIKKEK